MVSWSDAEKIVVLFFLSRLVTHNACADLLQHKLSSSRSTGMITNHVRLLKKIPGVWDKYTESWNIEAVDRWITSINDPRTPSLTHFGFQEYAIIEKVCYSWTGLCLQLMIAQHQYLSPLAIGLLNDGVRTQLQVEDVSDGSWMSHQSNQHRDMEALDGLQNKENRDHREGDVAGTAGEVEGPQCSCDGLEG
jgi:hypothetical protein